MENKNVLEQNLKREFKKKNQMFYQRELKNNNNKMFYL